jgi:hypothetical protein
VPVPNSDGRRAAAQGLVAADSRPLRWLLRASAVLTLLLGVLVALSTAAVLADYASGDTVAVTLVGTDVDHCTLQQVGPPQTVWEAPCRPGWTSAAPFEVRVGGLTDEPVDARTVLGLLVGGAVLMCLTALPLGIAAVSRRSRTALTC